MRKVLALVMVTGILGVVGSAVAMPHHTGGGLALSYPTADTEAGFGFYGYYQYDLTDMISVRTGLDYMSGDLKVDDFKETYKSLGVDLSVIWTWVLESTMPYLGVGTGYYFNDVDGIQIDDKLGMNFIGGVLFPVGDNLQIETDVRFRYLQPDSVELEKVEMDSIVFRAGLAWEF